ncbi:MAG: segregation/condensation protein A [Butyrivibrio sp.]|nr:segregation/condensation protein A [Butyrivibrio sp.]
MALEVKLEAFEGPLDLLLHLIDKNKVNIYDIPIALITDQYLDYVAGMEKRDLNVASEFLVMAAMLLDIKSRMLLPKEPEPDEECGDPRQELVDKLLEYKMYKYMSYELKDRLTDADRAMFRQSSLPDEVAAYEEPVDLEELTRDISLVKLREIFNEVMRRSEDKIDPVRSKFGKIEKEEIDLDERAEYVREYITSHRSCSFRRLLVRKSRMEIIVTFLVVLEMIKSGTVSAVQESRSDDIMINLL